MPRIALATCQKFPVLTPSDRVLADAHEASGANVVAAPWNGDFAPFAAADLTVVLSTWACVISGAGMVVPSVKDLDRQ